jgi:hypothetical protein
VDFKLENVLESLHSLKTMGLGSIIFKEWRVTWTFSQERTNQTVETWGTQDKKGQTRESGNMGYTTQEKTNQRQ